MALSDEAHRFRQSVRRGQSALDLGFIPVRPAKRGARRGTTNAPCIRGNGIVSVIGAASVVGFTDIVSTQEPHARYGGWVKKDLKRARFV